MRHFRSSPVSVDTHYCAHRGTEYPEVCLGKGLSQTDTVDQQVLRLKTTTGVGEPLSPGPRTPMTPLTSFRGPTEDPLTLNTNFPVFIRAFSDTYTLGLQVRTPLPVGDLRLKGLRDTIGSVHGSCPPHHPHPRRVEVRPWTFKDPYSRLPVHPCPPSMWRTVCLRIPVRLPTVTCHRPDSISPTLSRSGVSDTWVTGTRPDPSERVNTTPPTWVRSPSPPLHLPLPPPSGSSRRPKRQGDVSWGGGEV